MIWAILAASAAVTPVQPTSAVLAWRDGAVYPVATAPGRVTDIVLEPGERLAGAGPVAAGDTARWILGDTESGAGEARRVHVLAKPVAAGLSTNLVITTDRRTYHIELRSTAAAYMAEVAWRYPAGELTAVRAPAPVAAGSSPAAPSPGVDLEHLNFEWRIEGQAPWRPVRVFDDGRRVVVELPQGVRETPPLFERGPGGAVQLLNYRVVGRRLVVDRLFGAGELRLGVGKAARRVVIQRGRSS